MLSQQTKDITNTTFEVSSNVYQDEVEKWTRPILPHLKVSVADFDELSQLSPPAVDEDSSWKYQISVLYTNGVKTSITLTEQSTGSSVCAEIARSIGCHVSCVRLLKKTGEYVADGEAPPTDGFFIHSWGAGTPQPRFYKDYPRATRKLIMEAYRIHRDYVFCGTHVENCDPEDGSPDYVFHYIHKDNFHEELGPWEYDLEFWLTDKLYPWISCGAEEVFKIVFPGYAHNENSYGPPQPKDQLYHCSYTPWNPLDSNSEGNAWYEGISLDGPKPWPESDAELYAAELGAAELYAAELDAAELGATELGATELGATELGATELDAAELDATELDAAELGAAELDATELDATELDAAELDAAELDATELDATELDAAELDAAELDVDDLDECFDVYDDIPLNVRPIASKSRTVYSGKHIRQQEINQILAHSVQPAKPVKKVAAPVKTGTKSKQAASSWSHMRR